MAFGPEVGGVWLRILGLFRLFSVFVVDRIDWMQFQRICQCKSSLHRKSASRFFYGKLNKRTPMCIKDLIEKVPQKLIAVSSPVSCSFKSIEGQLQKVHFSNGYLRLF